jgi:hypothetical protein
VARGTWKFKRKDSTTHYEKYLTGTPVYTVKKKGKNNNGALKLFLEDLLIAFYL